MMREAVGRVRGSGDNATDKDVLLAALFTFVNTAQVNGRKIDDTNSKLDELIQMQQPAPVNKREIIIRLGTPAAFGAGLLGTLIAILDRILR